MSAIDTLTGTPKTAEAFKPNATIIGSVDSSLTLALQATNSGSPRNILEATEHPKIVVDAKGNTKDVLPLTNPANFGVTPDSLDSTHGGSRVEEQDIPTTRTETAWVGHPGSWRDNANNQNDEAKGSESPIRTPSTATAESINQNTPPAEMQPPKALSPDEQRELDSLRARDQTTLSLVDKNRLNTLDGQSKDYDAFTNGEHEKDRDRATRIIADIEAKKKIPPVDAEFAQKWQDYENAHKPATPTETSAQAESAEAVAGTKPPTPDQNLAKIADTRDRLKLNRTLPEPSAHIASIKPPDNDILAKGARGELTEDTQKKEYDDYVRSLEEKLANGRKLTDDETRHLESHLDRAESSELESMQGEFSKLGAKMNEEMQSSGKINEKTQEAFEQYLDKASGGRLSKNGLLAEIFNTKNSDPNMRAEINKRIAAALKDMTPRVAKEIETRIKALLTLDCQVRQLQGQVDVLTQRVWDIKKYYQQNRTAYDASLGGSDSDTAMSQNAQRKAMLMQYLNSAKMQLFQAKNSAVALNRMRRESMNYCERHLGLKNVWSFLGRGALNIGLRGIEQIQLETQALNYDSIEGNNPPLVMPKDYQAPDLDAFKPVFN